jgi:sulfur carrier protein
MTSPDPITISVNGETVTTGANATLVALLTQLGLAGKTVAIERNRKIVPRAEHATTTLAESDQLEIVTFVGGG